MKTLRNALAAFTVLAFAVTVTTSAPPKEKGPAVGSKAPSFSGKTDAGKMLKSSEVVGKKIVVLYFYPADFTGGCTKQACGFRDDAKKLMQKGVMVIGVSADTPETHSKFKKFHKLNFTLLADPDASIAKSFGVPLRGKGGTVKKVIDGKKELFKRDHTIARHTVVIGKDGMIAAKYAVKDAGGDSKKILMLVKKLQK